MLLSVAGNIAHKSVSFERTVEKRGKKKGKTLLISRSPTERLCVHVCTH